jgi:hypothetical protein
MKNLQIFSFLFTPVRTWSNNNAMHLWSPQDLSSVWKSLNTGGGARKNGNKHFCHLCLCNGNSIAKFSGDDNRYVAQQ